MNMVLLKYAGGVPLEFEDVEKGNALNLGVQQVRFLKKQIKEFVVCGYQITAEQAVGLTRLERHLLHEARDEFLRENMALNLIANEGAPDQVFTSERATPPITDELVDQYLMAASVDTIYATTNTEDNHIVRINENGEYERLADSKTT